MIERFSIYLTFYTCRKMTKPYFIAELSCNHKGSLDNAFELVEEAYKAGASAVKLQTFLPSHITMDCDNQFFKIVNHPLWQGRKLFDLYSEAQTPWKWHVTLKHYIKRYNMDFISSPFHPEAVEFLEGVGVDSYKVASFAVSHHPLLERIGETKKPVIMSTGLCYYDEILEAVEILKDAGCPDIRLLHCVSSYPTELKEVNLKKLEVLKDIEGVNGVGISDHSTSIAVNVGAYCLGARIFESHLKLKGDEESLDAEFSLDPSEFLDLTISVNEIAQALGDGKFLPSQNELKSGQFCASIFVSKDIQEGELITTDNIAIVRPGHGMHPRLYKKVLEAKARAKQPLKRGHPLFFGALGCDTL